jgi:hypothetical protein
MEKLFHNYNVTYHNELWASVFSGKFAAGTTWHRERVFWWPDALPVPPQDEANQFQFYDFQQFSTAVGDENGLLINGEIRLVRNKRLHDHFRLLADLLNRPSVVDLGIFSGNFTPRVFFDSSQFNPNPLECYYLQTDLSTAIGWVHNRNASVAKSFYVKSGAGNENFLGCTAPATASITLRGFFPLHAHYVTWFPTRIGATDLPPDSEFPNTLLESDANGDIVINLDDEFIGVTNNYLDTLHSDYAFVITPQPFFKSLHQLADETVPPDGWDFTLYPNPTRGLLILGFSDDVIKDVFLLDGSGRRVASYSNVNSQRFHISTEQLAKGAYWVFVSTGDQSKTKKLIIH